MKPHKRSWALALPACLAVACSSQQNPRVSQNAEHFPKDHQVLVQRPAQESAQTQVPVQGKKLRKQPESQSPGFPVYGRMIELPVNLQDYSVYRYSSLKDEVKFHFSEQSSRRNLVEAFESVRTRIQAFMGDKAQFLAEEPNQQGAPHTRTMSYEGLERGKEFRMRNIFSSIGTSLDSWVQIDYMTRSHDWNTVNQRLSAKTLNITNKAPTSSIAKGMKRHRAGSISFDLPSDMTPQLVYHFLTPDHAINMDIRAEKKEGQQQELNIEYLMLEKTNGRGEAIEAPIAIKDSVNADAQWNRTTFEDDLMGKTTYMFHYAERVPLRGWSPGIDALLISATTNEKENAESMYKEVRALATAMKAALK